TKRRVDDADNCRFARPGDAALQRRGAEALSAVELRHGGARHSASGTVDGCCDCSGLHRTLAPIAVGRARAQERDRLPAQLATSISTSSTSAVTGMWRTSTAWTTWQWTSTKSASASRSLSVDETSTRSQRRHDTR